MTFLELLIQQDVPFQQGRPFRFVSGIPACLQNSSASALPFVSQCRLPYAVVPLCACILYKTFQILLHVQATKAAFAARQKSLSQRVSSSEALSKVPSVRSLEQPPIRTVKMSGALDAK